MYTSIGVNMSIGMSEFRHKTIEAGRNAILKSTYVYYRFGLTPTQ